jgi:AP2 domain
MNSRRYIYRVLAKSGSASPYWAVMVNNKAGKAFKRFVDAKYGSEEQALAAAEKHRDAVVARLGLLGQVTKPDSPHPGVSRTESVNDRDGYPRMEAYWQAYWIKADGKQATRRFSIKKHGEEQAKKLAIAARLRADSALKAGVDPFFELPPSRAALWRYMDFTKFLAMLEDKALFFSSSSNFEDPFEGAYSLGNVFKRGFVMSRSAKKKELSLSAAEPKYVISCWYAAQHESAAMWSLYSKTADSIAIKTTVKRLRASLPSPAQMGLVKYVDYTQSWIPEDTPILRYFHKRISFQHEHELRAVVDLANPQASLMGNMSENGLKVGMDLNYLIEAIYIGPKSSDWFVDLVCAVCKRYGIKAEPTRSSLYDGPVL